MLQWIFKSNGNVVPQHSLQSLNVYYIHSYTEQKKHGIFFVLVRGDGAHPSTHQLSLVLSIAT